MRVRHYVCDYNHHVSWPLAGNSGSCLRAPPRSREEAGETKLAEPPEDVVECDEDEDSADEKDQHVAAGPSFDELDCLAGKTKRCRRVS